MPRNALTTTTGSSLLRALENNPALPALVRKLAAPELKKLIDHVGLEDAGAIVELSSSTQLAEVLDDVLWKSLQPGDAERLSIEEFVRWLELWTDIGRGFAAEKLIDLGETFCNACVSRLVTVVESGVVPTAADEYSAAYGEYVVRPQFEDEWDLIATVLNELWTEDPDFLLGVLGSCCFRHSILNVSDATPARRLGVLHTDAAANRETDRTARGFVLSADAGAFLIHVRRADLADLVQSGTYDLTTLRHFEAKEADAQESPTDETDNRAHRDEDLDALESALEDAEIIGQRQQLLLSAPEERSATAALRQALTELGERDRDAFSDRMNELAYLSNVLVVGSSHNTQPFSEGAAARAVLATCNVGFELLNRNSGDQTDAQALLDSQPGLVKAFAVGFHLISRLPWSTARQLRDVFRDVHVRRRYDAKPWVLNEVDALLDARFLDAVDRGDFDDAKDTLRVMTIALDDQASYCTRVLVDAFPTLPESLERMSVGIDLFGTETADAGSAETNEVDPSTRFIDSLDDLRRIEVFLARLAQYAHL